MATEGLIQAGADVFIASRKGEACEAAADELNALGAPGKVVGFAGDVGTEEGVNAMAKALQERTDKLHILMNNAGATWGVRNEDFPFAAWDKVMRVNCAGLFSLTQALLPILSATGTQEDPARVVNVGSAMGDIPVAEGAYSYAASKAGVHHLTLIQAAEYARKNITVNAFAPGPFESKMTAFVTSDAEKREKIGSRIPLGRIGAPSDIAGLMQFLCGKGGAYITGAIIPLSGGNHVETPQGLFTGVE
jgi:NAD(P)-dependent dehydrogenase (short-subunit alcohol dehydrogenase family)